MTFNTDCIYLFSVDYHPLQLPLSILKQSQQSRRSSMVGTLEKLAEDFLAQYTSNLKVHMEGEGLLKCAEDNSLAAILHIDRLISYRFSIAVCKSRLTIASNRPH